LEEIDAEINFATEVSIEALECRDYNKAKKAVERADIFTSFRNKVAALRKEWEETVTTTERLKDYKTGPRRRNLGKLRKGVRTPESAYYRPILQVLEQMGGSGKVTDVLERVGRLMKPMLKDVDYLPLPSSPDNPRWRNAAQWARNSMIRDGMLKGDSPRGIWEITDKGRMALREQKGA